MYEEGFLAVLYFYVGIRDARLEVQNRIPVSRVRQVLKLKVE